MTQQEGIVLISKALCKVKGQKIENVNETMRFFEDLHFESIDIVDFLFEFEEISGLNIELANLLSLLNSKGLNRRFQDLTVGDIVEFSISKSDD